jgi:hypothetical protein
MTKLTLNYHPDACPCCMAKFPINHGVTASVACNMMLAEEALRTKGNTTHINWYMYELNIGEYAVYGFAHNDQCEGNAECMPLFWIGTLDGDLIPTDLL